MPPDTLFSIAFVALSALITIDLCIAADPECLYREIRNLPMHWANPTDCGRYYRCTSKNVMREVLCTGNKEYNPNTGKCAPAGKGYCKLTYAMPLVGETNDCSHEVDGSYIPDNEKCRDFYICLDKLAYPQECDEGSYFNSTSANCQPDKKNECWQNLCLDQANGTTRADHESCLSFYICYNNEATLQKCDSGSYYNATDGNCQPDKNSDICWENFCLNATNGELIKNPDNCHGYYSCNNKVPVPEECIKGSYFDWNLKICQAGECPSDETTPTIPTETPTPTVTPKPTEDCTEGTTAAPCETCTCPGGYKEGELLPYPDNCMQYYICTGGVLVARTCYDGNYFDKNLGTCQPDTEGVCPQCGSTSRRAKRSAEDTQAVSQTPSQYNAQPSCMDRFFDGDIIPHEQCNKYQVCSEGELKTYDCGIGNYFNQDTKACVTDNANLCSPQSKTNENVFSCMDRYFEGQIVPHSDCNKFLICSEGQLHIQECGAGSFFNPQLEVCVRDEQNLCKIQTSSVQQANEQTDRVSDQSTNCTCPGGYAPGEILSHPSQCNSYYICQNGQLVVRDCGKGNFFDDTIGVCMPDTENKCNPVNESSCGCDENICVGQPNGKLLPDKNKCNSFYQCLNGEAQANTCEADEWFDPAKGSCEVDLNAVCINPCLSNRGINLLPHPDCSKYYMCNNAEVYVRECITGGFDPKIGVCIPDADCESNLCRNKSDGTVFEYSVNKTKFYVCLSDVAILNNCLENSEFDSSIGVCLPTPSKNCNQALCQTGENLGAFPTLNRSENSFCTCREGVAFEMNCSTNYIFNALIGVCLSNAPCDPEICLDGPEYTVSKNQNDTHSFCLCVSEEPVIVDCPKNGTFYESILECRPMATQDSNCDPTYCLDKPDYTTGPAISSNDGFCICNNGGSKYYPCLDGSRFNIELGICVPTSADYSCDKTVCADGKTTIFPTLNDEYSFCYCENSTNVAVRSCPSGYKFSSTQLVCLPEFCDSKECLNSSNQNSPFPAIDYPYGFCMCNGTTANLYECAEGTMFDPNLMVCTSEVNLECDKSLCRVEGKPYPYDTPAMNDPYSFCYCLSKDNVELFHCPVGKIYNMEFGACLDEEIPSPPTDCEDKCTCPGGYPAGSILPHPENCDQYYICSNGVLKLSNCAEGNYFSASQGVCIVDENKQCTENNSMPTSCVGAYHENEVIANPSNRHMFYRCLNSCLHLESCDTGYYFNAKRGICIPELLSNWNYKPRSLRSINVNDDEVTLENDSEDNAFNNEDIKCQNNKKRSVPSNCSQYEICQDEKWRRRTCNLQRYYNPEEQKCIEPRDDMVCNYAKVSGLPACTNETEHQTLPHKNVIQCGQYFRCVRGKWRLKYCRKSEYYSRRLRTCLQTNLKNICEARNESEVIVQPVDKYNCQHMTVRAIVGNCGKYLMCLEGQWWYQYCPFGMYFNDTMNYCMPNDEGQCDMITWMVSSELNDDDSCNREGEQRSTSLNCNSYIVCTNGKWRSKKCEIDGFYYNSTIGKCLEDIDGKCKIQCIENEKHEFPLNCTAYEICHNGIWERRSCEKDFMYDALMEECVPNNDGDCSTNGLYRSCRNNQVRYSKIKGNCSHFFYCEANNWLNATCLYGHTYSVELNTCVPHDPNDRCRPIWVTIEDENLIDFKEDIEDDKRCDKQPDNSFVSHPNDCTRYYVCLNGTVSDEFQCSIDRFFDAKEGYCRMNDGSCIEAFQIDHCKNVTSDSLIPNPIDCRSYYNCSITNDTNQIAYCTNGKYFDHESLDCRLDDGQCGLQSPQSKCGTQFEFGRRLPHERYCNVFYACVNNISVPFECPNGYQFNPVLELCLEDIKSQCLNGEWLINRNETNLYSCGNLTNGTLLPNRVDCRRYFNCSNGYAEPERCSEGTYFDSEQLLCIPDDRSVCLSNNNDDNADAGNDHRLNNKLNAPEPFVCEGKHGALFPDPANCNEFYVCINGKLKHERCYTEYFFNLTLNQCQPYEKLNNETKTATTTTIEGEGKGKVEGEGEAEEERANLTLSSLIDSTKMTNETPTLIGAYVPDEQCMDKPTNFSDLCIAAQIPDGSSISLQGDCRRYISCQDNVPMAQRCRNGESYDSLFGFCRQNDGTCLLENGQRVGECNGRHGQLTRDAANCRGYFICINGQKIPGECDENEYFDKMLNSCQRDTQMQCSSSPKKATDEKRSDVSCDGLSEITFYPYIHDHCRSYFQCINGTPKIDECADGLYFDAKNNRCVKEIHECVMPQITRTTITTTTTATTTTTEAAATKEAESTTEAATTEMPNNLFSSPDRSSDANTKNRCESAVIGKPYADIDDNCRSYYICTNIERMVNIKCPEGTLYSTEKRACAAASHVVCKL